MRLKKIYFLTEDFPGGAATNKNLLQDLILSLTKQSPLECFETLDGLTSSDSEIAFYFQDSAKISSLKHSYPEAKLILECHILNTARVSFFLPTLRADYEVINQFRKVLVGPESITEEIFEMKRRACAEKPLLELADIVISNSPSTTSFLKNMGLRCQIIDTTLTNTMIEPGARPFRAKSEFLFYNPPEISKGFHYLLKVEQPPPIDVWGNFPHHHQEFDLEKLAKRGTHFRGRLEGPEHLRNTIGQYRFALFPSLYESRSLALDECLRLGVIPFCQKTNPGFLDQVSDGVNGFLIDFRDNRWGERVLEIEQSLTMDQYLKLVQNALQTSSVVNRNALIFSSLQDYW